MRLLKLLVTPRWLLRHLLAALAIALFVFLGKWQWNSSMGSQGTLQNLFYAFNWWLFACLVVFGWSKTLHEDLRDSAADGQIAFAADGEDGVRQVVPRVALPALYAKPRSAELDAPIEDDPDLVAYNAYLAELNQRSSR